MLPVLILLSQEGFDPSEAAIPWLALKRAGIPVMFATPAGKVAAADPLMVAGEGLDLWSWLPGFKRVKLVGWFLGANRQAREAYAEMMRDSHYLHPLSYDAVRVCDYSGLLLPGGHAKPIRAYLESEEVQRIAQEFFVAAKDGMGHKPVAAICHGVLVLARSRRDDGRSLLHGRRVTALTWPLEKKAWQVARFSRFWEPLYYRTYPEAATEPLGYRSTEAEITRALAQPGDFLSVPPDADDYRRKTDGLHRDTPQDSRPAWVVEDGNLVTARWPGDVNKFAEVFIASLQRYTQAG